MPGVQVRIHRMNNGKTEISCKAGGQPHSRPYDTTAEAKTTLLLLGLPGEVADAYLSRLVASEWIDAGEYQIADNVLNQTGFTAV